MWYRRSAIGWCQQDNVPLLGAQCDMCGSEGKPIATSWRGEMRPLSSREAEFYNAMLLEEFGVEPLCGLGEADQICHWVEDVHRHKHVANIVSGGEVVLRVFFSGEDRWRLIPTVHFGRAFQPSSNVERIPKWDLIRHKSIWLARESPHIFLRADSLVAVAQLDGEEEKQGRHKYLLKGLGKSLPAVGRPSSLSSFVKANQTFLDAEVADKRARLQAIFDDHPDKPLLVSFSGGKDSSVILDLVAQSDCPPDREVQAVFLDTRNEFTETTSLIPRLTDYYDGRIKLEVVRTPFDFFELWSRLGPPSWENRWCCKTQKFLPLTEYLEQEFPYGVVTISGTRGMESVRREKRLLQESKYSPSSNPYLQLQIVEIPLIGDWSSLTVWLYLIANKIPFNPLYLEGLHRLGCWACPAAPLTYFAQLQEYRPFLFNHLIDKLRASVSEDEHTDGELEFIQRWKDGDFSRVEELHAVHIDGKIVIEDETFGMAQYITPLHKAGLEVSINCAQVSGPGDRNGFRLFERQLKRALYCVRCSKCVSVCPTGAIMVTRRVYHVDCVRCTGCLKCVEMDCPALNFEIEYTES